MPKVCTPVIEKIRPLQGQDFANGFIALIQTFRPCRLDRDQAGAILRERLRTGVKTIVALQGDQVIGTASLIVDHKFINDGGKMALIEDVIVLPSYQGMGIGEALIRELERLAQTIGCYKINLYCSDELVSYYAKFGFRSVDAFMRKDFEHSAAFLPTEVSTLASELMSQ